jgi:hypothetical protein
MAKKSKRPTAKGPATRYVAVVPAGQKFVPPARPARGEDQADRSRLAYRLMLTLDDALRTLMRRRGELSKYMLEALESADLLTIPLVDIRAEAKAPEVNMRLPVELHDKVRAAAEKRGESLNTIVNSAIAQWLAGRRLVDIRPL